MKQFDLKRELGAISFFCASFLINFLLLIFFSISYFGIYFLTLFISLYILSKYYEYYKTLVFCISAILLFSLTRMENYDEYYFEIFLFFGYIKEEIYINSEIKYALIALHLIFLHNLKNFENFWAIIDKKFFRI